MERNDIEKATLLFTGIKLAVPLLAIGCGWYWFKKNKVRNQDGTTAQVAPSLDKTIIKKENLTISTSDAALYANTLYGAMLDFGTDEKTIYNTIAKIKTKDDMLLVIKSFGMKMYLMGTRAGFIGQNYNLIGWLRFELNEKEIAKIKPKFDNWGIPI